MHLDTVTIQITAIQAAALWESATDLIGVKSDAIAHAERDRSPVAPRSRELDAHRSELAQVAHLAAQLERAAEGSGEAAIDAVRGTLDEVLAGALITEAERLSAAIAEIGPLSELRAIGVRLDTLRWLLETLAGLRMQP